MKDNEIIICSNCYEENRYGENYCQKCGKRLYYNLDSVNEEQPEETNQFVKEFDNIIEFNNRAMAINKEKKELYFLFNDELDKLIKYESIIECKIIENSSVVNSGGIGRAIVGGLIAGDSGAIVGANTRKSKNIVSSLLIRIVTKEIDEPLYTLELLDYQIDTNKQLYANLYKQAMEFANNVYATIQAIIKDNNNTNVVETKQELNSTSGLEQLEKLAELKDKGIITQEEFEETKKKILDNIHNGEIILLHSTSKDNSNILDYCIKEIKNMGYEFKSLDEFE